MRATLRVNTAGIPGYGRGQEIQIDVDAAGTPLDQRWRRRLRDAKADGCCELVAEKPEPEPEPEPETKKRRRPGASKESSE